MPKRLQRDRSRGWRITVRAVAFFFLLLAFADLALPQFCREDSSPLYEPQAATASFLAGSSAHQSEQHSIAEEDCFCCCSHIVSEEAASPLGALAWLSGSHEPLRVAVPSAPVRVLDHPPRLA